LAAGNVGNALEAGFEVTFAEGPNIRPSIYSTTFVGITHLLFLTD
jgi:hypothetical protein